ncbi:MAG: hypothetical protein JW808_05160, partial [Victivallales bacterium]|nr:hypothetical protein [Victivallales bacterium]
LRVDIEVKGIDGVTIWSDHDRTVTNHSQRLEGSSKEIAPGAYTMIVTVRRGDKALGSEKLDFYRPGRAVWYDNRHGFDDVDNDRVPYPWTDMGVRVQGSGGSVQGAENQQSKIVSVWGREYRFGAGLLPEQVTTLGEPILRAPIRMRIRGGQGPEIDTSALEAKIEWPRTDRTRVEGIRAVDAEGLAITNTFWAEYDGFCWATLRVTPKTPLTVESMEIEVSIAREFSDVIKGGGAVGRVRPEGHDLRYGMVWLGNGDGGIQFFIDGDLRLQDRINRSMRLDVAEDGAATLRLKIVDQPVDLNAPLEIGFGFMATPVRPNITRTPYFRRNSVIGGGPFYPSGLESLPAPDPGSDAYGFGGKAGRIYVWTDCVSIAVDASGTEDFRHYGAEWMRDPFQKPRLVWNTQAIKPYGSKSFLDYFVWRHWRYQNKYGYGGLYYDNPNLEPFANRELIKRLYNVTLGNTFLAGREMPMGLASNGFYNMVFGAFFSYQWNGEHLNSAIHAGQPTYLGLIGPAVFRAEYMGHNWGWSQFFLGQERLRPEWVEASGGPEAVIDQFQGLELLHDCRPSGWHIRGAMDAVTQRAVRAYERHDLAHWTYQFTPYWKQDLVTLPSDNMYASFYIARPSVLAATNPADHMGYPHGHRMRTFRHYFNGHEHLPYYIQRANAQEIEAQRQWIGGMHDRAVMVVYNDSDWEGEMRLKPDWKKLGLGVPETLKATNAVHSTGFRIEKGKDKDGKEVEKAVFFPRPEETAKIENGELVFPMTKFNYRMIVFTQKNESQ